MPVPSAVPSTIRRGADTALRRDDILAPHHGLSGCWARHYDAAHLAGHPDQLVTWMALSIDVAIDSELDTVTYGFGLGVQRRGETGPADAVGQCYDRPEGVGCYAECDGGGFLLRRTKTPVPLLLDMRHVGFLRVLDCGEDEGDAPSRPDLTPGHDDRVFLLYPAEPEACHAP